MIDINNKVQRINPLNEYDVAQLKKIAKANAEAKEKRGNGHGFQFANYSQTFYENQKISDYRKKQFLDNLNQEL